MLKLLDYKIDDKKNSYQINMRLIGIIKHGHDFRKVGQNFIVPRHIRRQYAPDHPLPDLFEIFASEGLEDVAILVFQKPKGHATVMILQWRDVIVANCQFCLWRNNNYN